MTDPQLDTVPDEMPESFDLFAFAVALTGAQFRSHFPPAPDVLALEREREADGLDLEDFAA